MNSDELLQIISQATDEGWSELKLPHSNITKLPPSIGQVKTLLKLDLRDNIIEDLPVEIGELKNLVELDISHNKLKSLPDSLFQLRHLTLFYANNNAIRVLQKEINNLTQLAEIDLASNRIRNLPNRLSNLVNLKAVDLSVNELSYLPQDIFNIPKLIYLNVTGNAISVIPEITDVCNLKSLEINANPDLRTIPQLDFIHLDHNKKQGKLRQTLDQEVANADPASRIYHDTRSLCESVLEIYLGTCQNIVDRRNPFSC